MGGIIPRQFAESYTSLSLFQTCPWQYYHKYRLRDLPESTGPALQRGQKVHEELEIAVKDKKPLHNIWLPEGLLEKLQTNGARSELSLAVNREMNRVDFWDEKAIIRGKLDIVYVEGNKIYVIDWKTGQLRVNDLQAEIAHLLLTRGFPKEINFEWVFVDQAQTVPKVFDQKASVSALRLFKAAEDEKDFPPKKCWMCDRFCLVPECPERGKK